AGSETLGNNGKEDDCALDSFFPIRFDPQIDQTGINAAKQEQAQEDAEEIAAAAGDYDSAYDRGSNDFEFKTGTGIWVDLRRLDDVHQGSEAHQCAGENKHQERHK